MRLEPTIRPLTEAERRLLRWKLRRHRMRPEEVGRRLALGAGGLVALLWLATLLATDEPWPVVTVFWLVVGGLIYLWVRSDLQKETRPRSPMAAALESALERNEAESYDVVARGYAEFEEVEDEGACYAFDLGDGRIVFLTGQQFYPSARFPSLDFSVVRPLDAAGAPADLWIRKRGDAAPPDRTIPGEVKWDLWDRIPGFPEVLPGSLEGLEESLRRAS